MGSTMLKLSSGFLTAALALTVPMQAIAAISLPQIETDSPSGQVVIKEWHWRNMTL